MKREDCFAIGDRQGCRITTYNDCEKCPFYKSLEKYRADEKAAFMTLWEKGLRGVEKTVRGYYESGAIFEKTIMTTERRSKQ